MSSEGRAFLHKLWSLGPVTLKILAGAHVFCEMIAVPQPCGGSSMLPTLDHTGDAVLLVPMAYWRPNLWGMRSKRPERGDIVVATNMPNPSYTVCKRVIGIEGDVVEIEPTRTASGAKSWAEGRFLRVPKGHVWIVGDNLSNSTDSRDYGPVPIAMVKGKVLRRVWHRGWPDWTKLDSHISEIGPSPTPPVGSVKRRPL